MYVSLLRVFTTEESLHHNESKFRRPVLDFFTSSLPSHSADRHATAKKMYKNTFSANTEPKPRKFSISWPNMSLTLVSAAYPSNALAQN